MKQQTYKAQICKCLANQPQLYLYPAAMQQSVNIWISILIHEIQPGSEPNELQIEGTLMRFVSKHITVSSWVGVRRSSDGIDLSYSEELPE